MSVSREIPFFDYGALFRKHESRLMPIIQDVLRRGAYIMQRDLHEFETNLATYLGVRHAIGVADGTIALVMALRASGVGPGDEVIVPSHTFVASAAAIHHAGGIPVLADCGEDHLIASASVRRVITARTRALMPVQLNGRTADMDALGAIADEHGLLVIEDSAQALGSKFRGRFAGTFGTAGTFSFYPSKLLGGFGDGGAVVTDNDDVAERVRLLRDHGRSDSGDVVAWGYNARLDNLQAAVLNYKLSVYGGEIERRRHIASIYDQQLRGLPGLRLPPRPSDHAPNFDVYQNYEIESDHRDELRECLKSRGIGTIIQWGGKTVHQFSSLGFSDALPVTDRLTKRFMLLPMNTSLSDDDVYYICGQIGEFYDSH